MLFYFIFVIIRKVGCFFREGRCSFERANNWFRVEAFLYRVGADSGFVRLFVLYVGRVFGFFEILIFKGSLLEFF